MGSSRFLVRFRMLAAVAIALALGACAEDKVAKLEPIAQWTPRDTADVTTSEDGPAKVWNFGTVRLGLKHDGEILIGNVGSAPMTVKYPSTLEAPFAIGIPPNGLVVGVGEEKLVTISFAPSEEGPFNWAGTLEILEDPAQKIEVRLAGVGEAPAFTCDTDRLDFGKVAKGTTKSLSVTCTNNSDVQGTLVINEIEGSAMFRHRYSSAGATSVAVDPDSSLEIIVDFEASIDGPQNARLLIESDLNGVTERVVRVQLQGHALDHVVACSPSSIDFGFVAPGGQVIKPVVCTNQGSDPYEITSLDLGPESDQVFGWLQTEFPIVIPAAEDNVSGEVTLDVVFQPPADEEDASRKWGRLMIFTSDPGTQRIEVVLEGFAGGPVITCVPSALDFGMVATAASSTRSFTCTNVGTDDPSRADDTLMVHAIESTSPEFQVDEASLDLDPNGYGVEESFTITVTYKPVDDGTDSAALLLHTNAINAVEEPYSVAMIGVGRDLPPCEFSIIPESLRFGIVEKNRTATLQVTVQNHLQDAECWVQNLELICPPHSENVFTLPGGEVELEVLPPLGEARFDVSFSPPDYREERYTCEMHFDISNEFDPHQVVPITGASQEPCALIAPNDLDFGAVEPGCATRDRTFEIINLCNSNLIVQGAELLDGTSEEFFLRSFPPANTSVAPGSSVIFEMAYRPVDEGVDLGAVYVFVEGTEEPYSAMLRGEGRIGANQHEVFDQLDKPKVDILWVIDNSGSMSPYQTAIGANLQPFLSFAEAQGIEYQVGVTTTGIITTSGCPGGADGGEAGRLFPVDGSRPRILTPYTPDLEAVWAQNVQVGLCHYDEQPLEAAYMALHPPVIDHCDDPRPNSPQPNDGNCGFLRREAHLSIIAVTDEIDQSPQNINFYYNAFQALKGFRNSHLFNFHAITGTGPGGTCGSYGERLIAMVEKTNGGVFQEICASDWEEALREMSTAAFGFKTCFNLMSEPADQNGNGHISDLEGEITVKLNGRVLSSKGPQQQTIWTYDRTQNAICFEPLTVPEPGSQLEVDYKVACISWE